MVEQIDRKTKPIYQIEVGWRMRGVCLVKF